MPDAASHGTLSLVIDGVFGQDGYRLRLEWAAEGVAALAGACAVVVIVDVLSFTTSVDVAVARGGRVMPVPRGDGRATAAARAAGAVLAGEQQWSLRPASLVNLPADTLLALPSPNGATLSAQAATEATVLAGCLRNASSVAQAAIALADGAPIGIIPAGERWGVTQGPLRPGIEDLLGAGSVAAALLADDPSDASPEVRLAATTFLSARKDLRALLIDCTSGRELIAAGHRADVELAADFGCSVTAPILRSGVFAAKMIP